MVAPPDNDVLWARGLTYAHDGSPALRGVSMAVREGEIVAVTGPRGSGKTTLLRCLSGQLRAQHGEVWFNSLPVHTMGPLARERLRLDRFGWIDPEPVLVPELNAWENAALPLMLRGTGRRAAKAAALEWLERLDIRDSARKRPHALLQSERQRVVVARALVAAPHVLFADEPTAALHRAEHTHVLRTLTTAARSHDITVVLATHDPETASFVDRTISLLDGRHVKTVHLPSAANRQGRTPTDRQGRAPTEPNPRATPEADRRPTAEAEGHLAAERGGHLAAERGRRPGTKKGGRPAAGGDRRATAEGGGHLTTGQGGRPATERGGRPTADEEHVSAGDGKGHLATGRGGRPTTEQGRRPGTDEGGRPAAEEERRAAAEGGGGTAAEGEHPSADGEGRAACSLSA